VGVEACLNHPPENPTKFFGSASYIVNNVERLRGPMQKVTDFILDAEDIVSYQWHIRLIQPGR
jgi:hypothetical protein